MYHSTRSGSSTMVLKPPMTARGSARADRTAETRAWGGRLSAWTKTRMSPAGPGQKGGGLLLGGWQKHGWRLECGACCCQQALVLGRPRGGSGPVHQSPKLKSSISPEVRSKLGVVVFSGSPQCQLRGPAHSFRTLFSCLQPGRTCWMAASCCWQQPLCLAVPAHAALPFEPPLEP
jgi:hypothetical protein